MTVTMQLLKGRAETASCTAPWPLRGQCWLCVPQPGSPAAPQDSPSEGSELWEAAHAPALNTGARSPQPELMDSRREGCSEKRDRSRRLPNGCRAPKITRQDHGTTPQGPGFCSGPSSPGGALRASSFGLKPSTVQRQNQASCPRWKESGPKPSRHIGHRSLGAEPGGISSSTASTGKQRLLYHATETQLPLEQAELIRGRRIPHPATAAEGTLLGRGRGHRPELALSPPQTLSEQRGGLNDHK